MTTFLPAISTPARRAMAMKPPMSVLWPYRLPSGFTITVFTQPTFRAVSETESHSPKASFL